jgi:hypothetical protein
MKNKEPLSPWSKIVFYNNGVRMPGLVEFVLSDEQIQVISPREDHTRFVVHRKQCRRLVKKPKLEFWVARRKLDGIIGAEFSQSYENLDQAKTLCDDQAISLVRVRVMEEVEIE